MSSPPPPNRPPADGDPSAQERRARAAAWLSARLDALGEALAAEGRSTSATPPTPADADVQADLDAIRSLPSAQVRDALEAEHGGDVDAVLAHLRGHLDRACGPPPDAPPDASAPPPLPNPLRRTEDASRRPDASPPRGARPGRRTGPRLEGLAAGAVAVFVVVLALAQAVPSRNSVLASLDAIPQDSVARVLPEEAARSVARLRTARSSVLGFFPRYDAEVVAASEAQLRASYDAGPPETSASAWRSQRALTALILGKAALMRRDRAEARRWLRTATADPEVVWADDAARLLAELDAQD